MVPSLFRMTFPDPKPIIGMLHLKGQDRTERRARARSELDILARAGFDGVIVENYFGSTEDVIAVLEDLSRWDRPLKVGINILGDMKTAFYLSDNFNLDFIQVDSVCGHLPPSEDEVFHDFWAANRPKTIPVLGGVRFKYQPVLSGREESLDVKIGSTRADAIVVTGDGTGMETGLDKTSRFVSYCPENYPIIIGAGLTADNVGTQLACAGGGIVGSWLKTGHVDHGDVNPEHVEGFMKSVREARHASRHEDWTQSTP